MDLTIIIPTTNFRGSLVSRALDYYRSFKINVIIVDNSKKKQNFKLNKDEKYFHLFNKDFIERIKSKNIPCSKDADSLERITVVILLNLKKACSISRSILFS